MQNRKMLHLMSSLLKHGRQGCTRVLRCLLIIAYDLQDTERRIVATAGCIMRLFEVVAFCLGLNKPLMFLGVVFGGLAYLVTVSCSAILSKHTSYHEQVPHILFRASILASKLISCDIRFQANSLQMFLKQGLALTLQSMLLFRSMIQYSARLGGSYPIHIG